MDVEAANAALLESWQLDLLSPVRTGAKPKRERTIRLYLEEADRFARWLAEHDRPRDLAAVTRPDVVAWIGDLRARGLAPATIRSRWIALRSLYGWASAEGVISENPIADVHVPKADEPPPDVLGDDTIRALLKACTGTRFRDRRDLALFRFLLATGLRVSEATNVALADVDLLTRIVAVTDGKGGRARVARFDPTTAAALDRYRRARGRHRLAARPELWIGHRGPMTRTGVYTVLTQRATQAGVGHIHPHQLRHSWAHRMKRAGASFEDLGQLGGWSSPEVLRRYGQSLAVERSLAAYDAYDPMSDL